MFCVFGAFTGFLVPCLLSWCDLTFMYARFSICVMCVLACQSGCGGVVSSCWVTCLCRCHVFCWS